MLALGGVSLHQRPTLRLLPLIRLMGYMCVCVLKPLVCVCFFLVCSVCFGVLKGFCCEVPISTIPIHSLAQTNSRTNAHRAEWTLGVYLELWSVLLIETLVVLMITASIRLPWQSNCSHMPT